jgi:hypothetical protein
MLDAVAPDAAIRDVHADKDWIVCGWFTEDDKYRPLADRLAASLNQVGTPYDLVATPKLSGGWEANTMAKPGHVLAAMNRHPGKTIVFLDVDCRVIGDLAPLVKSATSDIAIRFRAKARNNRMWMTPRSSTMVFRPTEPARRFVLAWADASKGAPQGTIDQTTFVTTLCRSPGVSFSHLGPEWGAMPEDRCPKAAIVHLGASNDGVKKVRGLRYLMGRLFRRL